MVSEQIATDQVERVINKRKCESIGDDRTVAFRQVGPCPVQRSDVEGDAALHQPLTDDLRDLAGSGGNFQQRKMPQPGCLSHLLNQRLCGGDAAEPAVDAAKIAQRGLSILRRTCVRVEEFGGVDALHRGTGDGLSGAVRGLKKKAETSRGQNGTLRLRPVLLPATACYTSRCSSRSRRGVRRACPVRRSRRRAKQRCGRRCARWKLGAK